MKKKVKKFQGFRKPHTVDTPDEWYLKVAPNIRYMSEMKVLLYIIYRTFGYRKWYDWIAISQFKEGLKGKNGDNGCGLSVPAILDGLERALEHGYIRCRITCPHCRQEVKKTDSESRTWKNRHGEGTKEIPVVPRQCPFCEKSLLGHEQPYYRLAFEDDIVDEYETPIQFLKRYEKNRGNLEKPSTHLEKPSSTHLEDSSSEAEKLDFSRSHSPSLHSPSSHSPITNEPPKTEQERLAQLREERKANRERKFGSDPAEGLLLAQARKAGDETSFTIPETAGGADTYKDGPLTQWCTLVGRQRANLLPTEERSWARELRKLAELRGADAETLAWALRQWGRAIIAYNLKDGKGRVWIPGNIAWMSPTPDTLFQYKDDPLRGISAFLAPLLEWGHEHGLSDIDLERGPQAQVAVEREEPPPRLEI